MESWTPTSPRTTRTAVENLICSGNTKYNITFKAIISIDTLACMSIIVCIYIRFTQPWQ